MAEKFPEEVQTISRKKHFWYMQILCMVIGLLFGVFLACLFPRYFDGVPLSVEEIFVSKPYLNQIYYMNWSWLWMVPIGASIGFVFGFIVNRFMLVANNPELNNKVNWSWGARFGKSLLGLKAIFFLLPAVGFFLYFGQFRPIWYRPVIFGQVPALWSCQQVDLMAIIFLVGEPDPSALPHLIKYYDRHQRGINRRLTVRAIGVISSRESIDFLVDKLVRSQDYYERSSAAYGLGFVRAEFDISPLLNAFQCNSDFSVRKRCLEALGNLPDVDKKAFPVLSAALRNWEWRRRQLEIIRAIGNIREIFAVEKLIYWSENRLPCPRTPEGYWKYNVDDMNELVDKMKTWLEKREHRLAWDAEKRKWYLMEEGNKGTRE
jgi:hypothetical protein